MLAKFCRDIFVGCVAAGQYDGDLWQGGHDWRYAVDASDTRKALGWEPRRSLAAGLEATVKWVLANEAWWRPILEGRYGGERLGLAAGANSPDDPAG